MAESGQDDNDFPILPPGCCDLLILLVDQFEEVWSQCEDTAERAAFIDALLGAASDESGPVAIIITLRSDFLSQSQGHPGLNALLAEQSLLVPALHAEGLRTAIAEPASRAGYPLDDATVAQLLEETLGRESVLPLLQFALTRITWSEAKHYAQWLGEQLDQYQSCDLPTETEWEYAARAGTTTGYALPAPDGSNDIISQGLANCRGCGSQWDNKQTAPVVSFDPNGWKLYDMHGNVWEWVQDCAGGENNDGSCNLRVLRGGSWSYYPDDLRSASRLRLNPDDRGNDVGFLVVCRPH